jgi:RNA polymerase sigma-70 factor (ECF subfamily)
MAGVVSDGEQRSRSSLSATKQVRDEEADLDLELVKRARTGDQEALTQLYRRHERRAYNLALRTLGDPWDAADVSQDAFIKAFKNLDSFKGEARFGTWLHRIVVNAAYDHLRRQKSEPMDSDILNDLSGPGGPATVVATGREGIDPAVDGLSDPLRNALMRLNEGFRFAVVLCDVLGFPYNEAAEILGVQEGTIKSRIFRAREALAATLTEAGYEMPPAGRGGRQAGDNGDPPATGRGGPGDSQAPDHGDPADPRTSGDRNLPATSDGGQTPGVRNQSSPEGVTRQGKLGEDV